jgi:actin-like protein 6A
MINPRDTPLIFTEPALHNKDARLKLTEFMFEKFQIPAIFIAKSPVLAAFSCGRSTAVVLDSGHKSTIATPVHDGYALQKCIIKHDIAGSFLTHELATVIEKKVEVAPRFSFKRRLYNNNGQEAFDVTRLDVSGVHPSYYNWCKEEIVRDVKEEVLYVSEDPIDERSLETIRSQTYELPDGQQISLQSERLNLTEKFFQAVSSQLF